MGENIVKDSKEDNLKVFSESLDNELDIFFRVF